MLLARAALALAVTSALGCGGGQHAGGGKNAESGDSVFGNQADFEPTSFKVAVSGKGRPIIFIPGLGCPGEMWNDTVERLGDGYQAHVLTLAGFAGVPPIKPPLAAKVRKELIRYIRSRKLEGAIVVGHSFGGFIAYWLGETAPADVLAGVVVVDAGPGLRADDEDARLLRNAWAQAGDDELPVQIKTTFSMMTADPKKMDPFLDAIAKSDRQSIGDAIYEQVKTTDVEEDIERIKSPTLLILADGGLQGRYKQMAEPIPDHEVVVVPRTKHFVFFDDPVAFHRVLEKFLSSHDDNH